MSNNSMQKTLVATTTFVCLVLGISGVHAAGHMGKADITNMTPEQLAEHLIFNSGSFKLDQAVQEGGVSRQRLEQEELQKACTVVGGGPVDPRPSAARRRARYQARGLENRPRAGLVRLWVPGWTQNR